MRIIDNNKDFYDFYQNIYRDSTFTFDRRDSYNLSREEFAHSFVYEEGRYSCDWAPDINKPIKFVLLQICNSFWLFNLTVTKTDNFGHCLDYEMELEANWKDYSVSAKLISLSHISFFYGIKTTKARIEAIRTHNIKILREFNNFTVSRSHGRRDDYETKHIPILQNIGIAGLVDPLDIYLAFEEFFALEKASCERTEAIGFTNDMKIEGHGFDLKKSFRK